MKFVFFGTPEFAAIILDKLINVDYIPTAVVCNPDKPVGRKKVITPPPVKQIIIRHKQKIREKIEILQPENLSLIYNSLFMLQPDLFIVAAYAKILPKEILAIPRLGSVGVHPSLLPKYRGPSPIQTAILNGDKKTGVSLFLIDEKMDHGPILANYKFQILNSKFNYESLMRKLAELGADLLIETLPKFFAGKITPLPQNEAQATYTKKFTTEDAYVEPKDLEKAQVEGSEIAIQIERKIRALNPEPGVWTQSYKNTKLAEITKSLNKRVKLLEANLDFQGKLHLKTIQLEGKKPIDISN